MADPRALTRAFYESFNTGDVEALADVVALDYVEVHDGVRHHLGLEGARAHVLGVRSPYGDLKIVVPVAADLNSVQEGELPWELSAYWRRLWACSRRTSLHATSCPIRRGDWNWPRIKRQRWEDWRGCGKIMYNQGVEVML